MEVGGKQLALILVLIIVGLSAVLVISSLGTEIHGINPVSNTTHGIINSSQNRTFYLYVPALDSGLYQGAVKTYSVSFGIESGDSTARNVSVYLGTTLLNKTLVTNTTRSINAYPALSINPYVANTLNFTYESTESSADNINATGFTMTTSIEYPNLNLLFSVMGVLIGLMIVMLIVKHTDNE